ncbi:MAG: efflux RND transporter periplasmic adaptor subunit [Candidatus Nealsonbacteria bacterium]|nr:efflux RND transporter periplasmic adaptor subunit [Candidatus Nealsonbacteria bacterium]
MSEQTKTNWIETIRPWIKPLVPAALLLVAGALLIFALGIAQHQGWISAGGGSSGEQSEVSTEREDVLYICPMMDTPPTHQPGRCPVCGMELVRASSGSDTGDKRSIQIDPASRRVANIRTAAVKSVSVSRKIRAVGQLSYDEGKLKTLAAYVDGRLDRLYADYTGVVVNKGDDLALLYSPELYTAQTELLAAKRLATRTQSSVYSGVLDSQDLQQSARRKLIDLGMTKQQIERIEETGQPVTRIELVAPIHGTVIAKLASEGDYVKTGQPIYRLADLSMVWLMLELFPEDAATIRYGQRVSAEVQSIPGQRFTGRVAFVDPMVDPQTRTIGVRVVISNEDGRLKVGDYATATVEVPVTDPGDGSQLVVPRNAVLMAATNSVVYVETEPGRFEIRRVELGPGLGDEIVLLGGVKEGEQVATNGNFLIDSQMQLAGNPSLIDPTRAKPASSQEAASPEILSALAKLSEEDRALAKRQRICPVTDARLGSMGTPPKVDVNGRTVFICCEGCREPLLEEREKYLAKLDKLSVAAPADNDSPQPDVPPIGQMEMIEPQGDAPPIGPIEMIEPTPEIPSMEPRLPKEMKQ